MKIGKHYYVKIPERYIDMIQFLVGIEKAAKSKDPVCDAIIHCIILGKEFYFRAKARTKNDRKTGGSLPH